MKLRYLGTLTSVLAATLVLPACGDDDGGSDTTDTDEPTDTDDSTDTDEPTDDTDTDTGDTDTDTGGDPGVCIELFGNCIDDAEVLVTR